MRDPNEPRRKTQLTCRQTKILIVTKVYENRACIFTEIKTHTWATKTKYKIFVWHFYFITYLVSTQSKNALSFLSIVYIYSCKSAGKISTPYRLN